MCMAGPLFANPENGNQTNRIKSDGIASKGIGLRRRNEMESYKTGIQRGEKREGGGRETGREKERGR